MKQKITKISIALLVLSIVMIQGCKKEEFPSTVKTASFPTITLIGDPIMSLNIGDTYNDPGATYYDSLYGDNGAATTSTVVNTTEEGFFIVTYTATNRFGFVGTGTRIIAVTGISDAVDISGSYARTSNNGPATVSKIGRGVFTTDNVSGAVLPGTHDAAFFMFTADSTIIMPAQFLPNFGVTVKFVDPVYDFAATPPNYSYIIDNSGFAPSVRTFEKQ